MTRKLPDHPDQVRMTIGEHLDELRTCLIRSLVALVAACLLWAYPARWMIEWVMRPFVVVAGSLGQPVSLLATSPTEFFVVYVKFVLVIGLVTASPYIFTQLWAFVGAGLYRAERDAVRRLVWPSTLLFLAGVVFMYVFVLMLSLNFLIGFARIVPVPDLRPNALERVFLGATPPRQPASQPAISSAPVIPLLLVDPSSPPVGSLWFNLTERRLKLTTPDGVCASDLQREADRALVTTHFRVAEYLNFVLVMMIAFGFAFQMPLVVIFLVRTGIVPVKTMRSYRKVVILVIVFVAGMLAPPDLLSHMMLSVPMVLLFEIGLLIAARRPPTARAAAPT